MKAADIFGLEVAFSIRDHVAENQACPKYLSSLADSQKDQMGRNYLLRGNENGMFHIFYKCDSDLNYSVMVSYSFDSQKYFEGTEADHVKITYGHHTDLQQTYVSTLAEGVGVIEALYE